MSTLGSTAVVLDLDGTLVDSEPNYFEASRRTLAEHGVPDFTWQEHESYVGISAQETIESLRQKYGIQAPVDALLTEMSTRYLALARARTPVYPQMRKLVERLHEAGVPMAVASGSPLDAIDAVLSGTGLDAQLRIYVSADEVAHGKPAPDVFLEAAHRLGVMPAHCTVMEDAVPGAAAAYAAGMRCIAIPYVAAQADDPAFATAGLLFRGGQREFTAEAAYDWLARTATAGM
ncbi:hydrolase [Streptomyces sp. CB01635]|uniref:HAD family hydrolase n=1 Tax=unclassified Streptomyces TaxID=2593676 RepID=UPI000C273437|nr:HAD family phosphatase [Streptomyces sp. CB01635]PJN06003.1 hydrolase [Streptomyces sp. CB01635]